MRLGPGRASGGAGRVRGRASGDRTHGGRALGGAGRAPVARRDALRLGGLALGGLALAGCSDGPDPSPREGDLVLLDVADDDGAPLDLEGLRQIQSNGAGEDGWDDQLLDADTLRVVTHAPLEESEEATCQLRVPAGRACALTLSWPTSHGYSALVADIPGPGRHALAELAARSLHERQDRRLGPLEAADPDAAAMVRDLRQKTGAALEACGAEAAGPDRARAGALALEAAATAQLALDRACAALAPSDALIGVTLTRPPDEAEVERIAALAGPGGAGARLVVEDPLDDGLMRQWRGALDRLRGAGVLAVVQVCDSQALDEGSDDDFDARLAALIAGLGGAGAWETGNELGGSWTGDRAVERTARAARALRDDPATAGAPRLLTLYYQLGQDDAEHSLLTWVGDNLSEELVGLTDVVGLSVYPQWHPLGTAADRVLEALGAALPGRRLAVSELGYGAEDLDDGPWWFGSAQDAAAARTAVAEHVTAAALGREGAWGAPFWWYYLQDEAPGARGGPVSGTLAEVAARARGSG